jgi:predicted O-methyltransferase YrrM
VDGLPPLVQRAWALARELGFPLSRDELADPGSASTSSASTSSASSSSASPGSASRPSASLPGVGRFLAMLAAGCTGGHDGPGRIGELGTGVGVGTAWMVSAMPTDCTLITVEIDERRAAAARGLFADDPRVEVITGDAFGSIRDRGPFDLLFSDGGGAGNADLVGLLRVGGRIVMDDVTPRQFLPPGSPYLTADSKRDFFASPRLVSVEVVLPDLRNSLLVGTRTSPLHDLGSPRS